ncbi:hypothetical protein [Alkalihalobacillus sp. BA299]|uniref:hypothetical protein n=1 Tax=Alkalihalobacillus sp. BA299 TaxID=2815938 RepID=UPI0035ABAF0B
MKELIDNQFINDDLKKHIELYDVLAEKLYPEFINKLHPETTYSTTEVASFLDKNDSTLRNYLRNENLVKYIKPVRSGRYYRLNYESVFRLHMILLYLEQGKSIADIEVILGYRSEMLDYDTGQKSNSLKSSPSTEQQLMLKKYLEYTNKKIELLEFENKIHAKRRDYDETLSEITTKQIELNLIETQISNLRLEKRNHQLLTLSLKRTIPQKSGLLNNLFRKQNVDIDNEINEATKQLTETEDPKAEEYKTKKMELKKEIEELKLELKVIKSEIKEDEKKLEGQKESLRLNEPSDSKANLLNE